MSLRPDIAPPRSTDETEYRLVGRPISHHDFREKVRGSLAYADDWNMPGMLYGRIVRAQVPSARIRSIDIAEASRIVGVSAVLTAADVPHNVVSEEPSGLGIDPIAMPVLAGERIRYQGEPVALVAAETPEIAEEAAEVARGVGVPATKVRGIGSYRGGGFGGKEDMTVEPYIALLVWATRRPVKMVWSRQESLLARPKRHPFTMRYRTAAERDGT